MQLLFRNDLGMCATFIFNVLTCTLRDNPQHLLQREFKEYELQYGCKRDNTMFLLAEARFSVAIGILDKSQRYITVYSTSACEALIDFWRSAAP